MLPHDWIYFLYWLWETELVLDIVGIAICSALLFRFTTKPPGQ